MGYEGSKRGGVDEHVSFVDLDSTLLETSEHELFELLEGHLPVTVGVGHGHLNNRGYTQLSTSSLVGMNVWPISL